MPSRRASAGCRRASPGQRRRRCPRSGRAPGPERPATESHEQVAGTVPRCSCSPPTVASPSTTPVPVTPSGPPGCRRSTPGSVVADLGTDARRAARAGRPPAPSWSGSTPPPTSKTSRPDPCRRRPLRRRHPGVGGLVAGRAHRGRGRARRGRRADRRATRTRAFLAHPPARPPRPPVPGAWASACSTTSRSPRPSSGRAASGCDRRHRRAPRQRHPGDLLRRPRRPLRLVPRVAAVPGDRTPRRDRHRRGRRARRATCRCPPARPATCTCAASTRSWRRCVEEFAPDVGADLRRVRRPPRRPAHRARALRGDYAAITERVAESAPCPGPGRSRSSRAATASRRCGTRSRRASRCWPAAPRRSRRGRGGHERRPGRPGGRRPSASSGSAAATG